MQHSYCIRYNIFYFSIAFHLSCISLCCSLRCQRFKSINQPWLLTAWQRRPTFSEMSRLLRGKLVIPDCFFLISSLSSWGLWFLSIKTNSKNSNAVPLFCCVPQGSVLGPLLVTLYTTPLSSLIHSHKLYHHLYADYTQVYTSLSTADTDISLKQLGDCLSDISGWMTNNKLRLNANKTDCSIISTSRQRSKLTRFFPTNIFSHNITLSDTVRNLGVTFDSDFNLISVTQNGGLDFFDYYILLLDCNWYKAMIISICDFINNKLAVELAVHCGYYKYQPDQSGLSWVCWGVHRRGQLYSVCLYQLCIVAKWGCISFCW